MNSRTKINIQQLTLHFQSPKLYQNNQLVQLPSSNYNYLIMLLIFALITIIRISINYQYKNKNMKVNRILAFPFSLAKYYDVVTVGPYANRVAKSLAHYSHLPISILTVEEQNSIIEPSLMPIGNPKIQIKQYNNKFSDIQMGVGVQQIDPESSQVRLKNGAKYSYKYLVYSGNPSDWKGQIDKSCHLAQVKQSHSYIYDDLEYKNMEELFQRRSGSVVITIPKYPHSAYQNFFMPFLKSKIQQKRLSAPFSLEPINFTVLCQQKNISFNQPLNRLLQDYLMQNDISLIKDVSYKIDYAKKRIKLINKNRQIKYNSLFRYLPLKVPKVLKDAKINPFQNNRHQLNNSKYENIYILGNVVNNIYSFSSINEMSKIITENILNSYLGIRRRAIYQGQSGINLWINDNQCHYVQTDYNASRLRKNIGQSSIIRKIVAYRKKQLHATKNMQLQLNSGCGINSIFNKPQYINTQRFNVPAIIDNSKLVSLSL